MLICSRRLGTPASTTQGTRILKCFCLQIMMYLGELLKITFKSSIIKVLSLYSYHRYVLLRSGHRQLPARLFFAWATPFSVPTYRKINFSLTDSCRNIENKHSSFKDILKWNNSIWSSNRHTFLKEFPIVSMHYAVLPSVGTVRSENLWLMPSVVGSLQAPQPKTTLNHTKDKSILFNRVILAEG